jgi:hypothetical protein
LELAAKKISTVTEEFMGPTITVVADVVRKTLADRLLPVLILGVVAAALFFTLVLGADASIGVGILVIGGVTAFLETASHRNRKP